MIIYVIKSNIFLALYQYHYITTLQIKYGDDDDGDGT